MRKLYYEGDGEDGITSLVGTVPHRKCAYPYGAEGW